MELSLMLLQKILVLFIMILMGFLSVKSGMVKSTDSSVLSKLSFDWIIPCSLLHSFNTTYDPEKGTAFLFACGAAIFSIIFYIVITRLIQKPLHFDVAEQGSIIFSNSAGIGAPLVVAVMGNEMMFYCAAHMGFQNIFIFIYLPLIMSREAKIDWKKLILNRNVIAIICGLLIFRFSITLPSVVSSAIGTIGGMLSPISMLMIGMLMGGVDFKKVLRGKRLYLVSLGRLLIYPLLFLLLVKVTGVTNLFPYAKDVLTAILICSSAPAAALVTQMADRYRSQEEAQNAGSINVMTTLFCVITMPLLVLLFQLIC